MFVGEIGISRTDYLYYMDFAELMLTSRGYFRRFHASWEQARLIAYHVNYCMGVGKGETVPIQQEWLPFPWEKKEDARPISEEEEQRIREELQRLRYLNKMNQS